MTHFAPDPIRDHAPPPGRDDPVRTGGAATYLCLKELDILLLRCASNGLVDKHIAKQFGIHPNTVHERWRRVRRILGARDRSHAVAIALSLGLIMPPMAAITLAQRLP